MLPASTCVIPLRLDEQNARNLANDQDDEKNEHSIVSPLPLAGEGEGGGSLNPLHPSPQPWADENVFLPVFVLLIRLSGVKLTVCLLAFRGERRA